MKNILFFATTALILTLSGTSNADTTREFIPYAGVDYLYAPTYASYGVRPHYHAFALNIGTKYNSHFGTEVFYAQSADEHKKLEDVKLKTSYQAYGLDATTYLPLCPATDLFITGGLAQYIFHYKPQGLSRKKDSGFGYRIGGGLMLNLNEHVSFRFLARYVGIDRVSDIDRLTEYALGFRYHF